MKNNNINAVHSLAHTSWNYKYHIVFVPKYSVSSFMGFLKGKSSIMIYSKWANMRYQYRNREFQCRGYYVDTVEKNTKKIKEYIANQLKEDRLSQQMTIEDFDPFKGLQIEVASSS